MEFPFALFGSAMGVEFLSCVLGADATEIQSWLENGDSSRFTDEQKSAIQSLAVIFHVLPPSTIENDFLRPLEISRMLGAVRPDQTRPLVSLIRAMAVGGFLDVPSSGDAVVDALMGIAADIFPLLFLPRERHFGGPVSGAVTWGIPARQVFEEAVLSDSDLASLFTHHDDTSGHSGSYLASTGHGGSLQLWTLCDTLLSNSWVQAVSENERAPVFTDFCDQIQKIVTALRSAVRGERCRIAVRVGLAGVKLPAGVESVPFPGGRLRPSRKNDLEFVPVGLAGKLVSTVPETGETVEIDYSGDIVMELEADYQLKLNTPFEFGLNEPEWPGDLKAIEDIGDLIDTLRLAFLLRDPEECPVLIPTWTHYFEPLSNQGFGGSYRDARNATGLTPHRVRPEDIDRWSALISAALSVPQSHLRIPKRRLLQAASERRDPGDVLVDAAIVWESLMGSQAETVLRVSGAMAWLLEPDNGEARVELQRTVKKLYGLRSGLVHGSHILTRSEEFSAPREALKLASQALLRMLEVRPDLLQIKDVAIRSNMLTLGR